MLKMILILSLVLMNFRSIDADRILESDAVNSLDSYTITFTSPIYLCSDDLSKAMGDTSQVEAYRLNESYFYIDGEFQMFKAIEDGVMLEIMSEREIRGSYEMVSSFETCDLCKELSDPESIYADFFKYIDFPRGCPIPAGTYHINKLIPDTKKIRVNAVTEGRYIVNFNIKENPTKDCLGQTTFKACFKVEATIEAQ